MEAEPLSDEQLRLRDLVYEGMQTSRGLVLTEHVMRQIANTVARALVGHFVRGAVAKGEIHNDNGETMEEHAGRIIK